MDIISHFVLGAALGGVLAAKRIGNKAILWGGIFSLFPFIDVIASWFFDTTTALYVQGGFSHSIVFCALLAPILGWIVSKIEKYEEYSVIRWANLAFWCMLSHCAYDLLTISGTGVLEPFSHRRFSLSILADFDFTSLLPLLIACIVSCLVSDGRHKAMISWFGLFLFAVYATFAFMNKLSVQSQFEQSLNEKNVRYSRVEVFPIQGALFMWNCVAQDRDGFWMCNQSNLSKNDFELNLVLRNDYYLFDIEENTSVKQIEAFTRNFYSVEPKSENIIYFHDLRYARRGLQTDDEFLSSYEIRKNDKNVEIKKK